MDVDHFHELGPKLAKSQVGLVPKGKRDLRIRSQLGAIVATSSSCTLRGLLVDVWHKVELNFVAQAGCQLLDRRDRRVDQTVFDLREIGLVNSAEL